MEQPLINMSNGILCLEPLHKFLRKAAKTNGWLDEKSVIKRYNEEVMKLCQDIPNNQGFYLWGRYGSNGFWRNIYLGKAAIGKTANLRNRIEKELKVEKSALWRTYASASELASAATSAELAAPLPSDRVAIASETDLFNWFWLVPVIFSA